MKETQDSRDLLNNVELSLGLSLNGRFGPEPESNNNRKRLQSLRRLEAKRQRVEKLKNVRMVKQSKPKVRFSSSVDEKMPCVTTKVGKRIQGFLYRYGEDEEVRIVCVCHGSFLTPAEFVKHGGGGEVEHPLRHIVVTSLFT
ncbi:putative ethylene-responsive binding factor-associated repression, Ninja family [Helianthus annuus]|uniref:Ninja-family protein n=2 Tax=Helianthus annuus TaxID=4232 RepID=A0A251SCH6_HELAN|nr:ninja-family protein AFP3 [Helianthus annuus]KAF5766113.1 putative ethylene-responsive binding factor-associated repression, Ninja family [Helianthus annuus]KAJ0452545.1 putative ethylene-responsive binding factor-associated repression, Ninja family [Helianthus annuus]KAJ0457482.1 putative ethylene-responsive binding factor-associated repression, Ninja family [Helianthus annuus]KAJ0474450.1 putative ethylene-responsive binding factor-associated repression, Ninja family [Helianthus annuus]KA